jgi:hypothetical protein
LLPLPGGEGEPSEKDRAEGGLLPLLEGEGRGEGEPGAEDRSEGEPSFKILINIAP